MANMGYCRFENTARDVQDCFDHLDDDNLSEREKKCRRELIDWAVDIACGYGEEVDRECEEL
jgi:hypothetical protein